MNYLAHALLSEPHAYSLIGNVAGDLVKGSLAERRLHPRVMDGIRRHRRVDALTDSHPLYRELRNGFPRDSRRVAPIVLDVLFDHYLVRHWSQLTSWDYNAFIDGVYTVLSEPAAPLPAPLAARAPAWVSADWLRVYASMEGVAAVLERLSRRTSRRLPLDAALTVAREREAEFAQAFVAIFSDVRAQLDGVVPTTVRGLPGEAMATRG